MKNGERKTERGALKAVGWVDLSVWSKWRNGMKRRENLSSGVYWVSLNETWESELSRMFCWNILRTILSEVVFILESCDKRWRFTGRSEKKCVDGLDGNYYFLCKSETKQSSLIAPRLPSSKLQNDVNWVAAHELKIDQEAKDKTQIQGNKLTEVLSLMLFWKSVFTFSTKLCRFLNISLWIFLWMSLPLFELFFFIRSHFMMYRIKRFVISN